MNDSFPLVTRELDAPIAVVRAQLKALCDKNGDLTGIISTRTFLSHVQAVASTLGDGKYAINMCDNRYLFLVSFCAVIVRGHTNLLPPNKNVVTQEQLANDYDNTYIISDGCQVTESVDCYNLAGIDLCGDLKKQAFTGSQNDIPKIANRHIACISFTSGSTGKSKPNIKYWETLHVSTAINYQYMIPNINKTLYQLATVPAQHMWGLETSILMPLFHNICTCDAKPLFPQDIADALASLPEPKMLVSTPVHLRAFLSSKQQDISLHAVLCATSPLTQVLAQDIESRFGGVLIEVYGCSEVGSMAAKQTARTLIWERFGGINFESNKSLTIASAAHLPEKIELQDCIELQDNLHFILKGRTTDLIKIAGKRGSLSDVNQVILSFDEVIDAVAVMPKSEKAITRLCALVVFKNGATKSMLAKYLREHLDSACIPRPIYAVNALPRQSNGKLLKSDVDSLLVSLQRKPVL